MACARIAGNTPHGNEGICRISKAAELAVMILLKIACGNALIATLVLSMVLDGTDGGGKMRDSIGKRPNIKSKEDALKIIRKIALDKRCHALTTEHVKWLELRLKEIALVAYRGLHL